MALSQQELDALKDYLLINSAVADLIATEQWTSIQFFLNSFPSLLDKPTGARIQLLTVLPDTDKAKLYNLDDVNISFLKWLGALYEKKISNQTISPIILSSILSISEAEINQILTRIDVKIQEERLTEATVPRVIRALFELIGQDKTQDSKDIVKDLLVALLTDGLISLSVGLVFYVDLTNTQERWRSLNLSGLPTVGEIETALT